MYKLLLLPFLLSGIASGAQVIDNTASFRMVNQAHALRLQYDNDYFSTTDEYYTQGINLEFISPALKKNPVNYLLLLPQAGTPQYGMALEHLAYTPTSISSDEILYDDRPFAGAILAKFFATSSHASQRMRITSSLSLGMIGKVARTQQIQRGIHRWIGDTDPKGWQYQIKNDLILNYEAGIEKNLLHSRYFLLNYLAAARVGTLSDQVSAGATVLLGKLNSSLTSVFAEGPSFRKQKFTFHVYAQPVVQAVFYDATLQGGLLFNRHSPYTLSYQQTERLVFRGNAGLVLNIGAVYVEYFQSVISKEFETAHTHHWGGLRIGAQF